MTADIAAQDDDAFLARMRSKLESAERERSRRYDQYIWRRKAAMAAFAVLGPLAGWVDYMLLFVWPARGDDGHGAGLAFLLAGGLYAWATSPKRAYARTYKLTILPDIAALFGLRYDIDRNLPVKDMRDAGILPAYDRAQTEDYFEGAYRGAQLRFAEIKLEDRRSDGKRTRYVTVFKGLGVIIAMPQRFFYGHTVMVQNGSGIGEWLREKTTGLQRADLVDPVFEGRYSVFTNDQTEARYLLDPAVIERINAVEAAQTGQGVSVAYHRHQVFIAVSAKRNLFEPADIYIPATDIDSMRALQREIAAILAMIDQLAVYRPQG